LANLPRAATEVRAANALILESTRDIMIKQMKVALPNMDADTGTGHTDPKPSK
jgi:hypothetical protein